MQGTREATTVSPCTATLEQPPLAAIRGSPQAASKTAQPDNKKDKKLISAHFHQALKLTGLLHLVKRPRTCLFQSPFPSQPSLLQYCSHIPWIFYQQREMHIGFSFGILKNVLNHRFGSIWGPKPWVAVYRGVYLNTKATEITMIIESWDGRKITRISLSSATLFLLIHPPLLINLVVNTSQVAF